MKTLHHTLWSIVILIGVSLPASVQIYPRSAEKFYSWQLERQIAKAQQEASLIHLILTKGKQMHFSYVTYTIENGDLSTQEAHECSKNGQVYARVYSTEDRTYFLLNRANWEDMYNECVPNAFVRTFNAFAFDKKIYKQVFLTDEYSYIDRSPSSAKAKKLTDISSHDVKGKKYTLITYKYY